MMAIRTLIVMAFTVCLVIGSYGVGYNTGHDLANRTAYDTRNVSEGLEMACAGLWIGEQNKKYAEKNK